MASSEAFECENTQHRVSQTRKFKVAICTAFALGMVVGMVGLYAGLGVTAGNKALNSALWGVPVRAPGATHASTQTITGVEPASIRGARVTMANMENLNEDLMVKVSGSSYCARRDALAKAAALAAAAIGAPSLVSAGGAAVKMGSDSGQLVFVPSEVTVCKGDKITWTMNKAGPHNVVFDEDTVPSGVDAEKISMDGLLGDPGETYSVALDTPGTYGYRCEPHAGGGMIGSIEVKA
jgi:plastocyanin